MRKQKYSVRPGDEEVLGLQQRDTFIKRKSVVEGHPKENWSGIEIKAGSE